MKHESAVAAQVLDGSKFTAKQDIFPFIDAIGLVKLLISECVFIAVLNFHFLSLLVLSITRTPPSKVKMSAPLFHLVQSSCWHPCAYLPNTEKRFDPKHIKLYELSSEYVPLLRWYLLKIDPKILRQQRLTSCSSKSKHCIFFKNCQNMKMKQRAGK